MNKAELQKDLFSGDITRITKAYEKLTSMEIRKIAKITNEASDKHAIEPITFGAFIDMLYKYKYIKIDRKRIFDILRNLKLLDEDNNPTKISETCDLFSVSSGYYLTVFGGIDTKEILITPFGQLYLTEKVIEFIEKEEKYREEQKEKDKQIIKEFEDKQEQILDYCRNCDDCDKCIFNNIAEFVNKYGDTDCKINETRQTLRTLSENEINEYYKALEDYKKQEEKEVSVDDMKETLLKHCESVSTGECVNNRCVLSERFEKGCHCSVPEINRLSDYEVKERYNIVMNSKGKNNENRVK